MYQRPSQPSQHASLSLFWFLYFAALGLLFPFFSLYLSDNAGLSGTEVGVVVTMSPLVALVAPTLWGRLADRSRSPVAILRLAALGVAALTMVLGLLRGFWPIAIGAAALAVFTTGVLPLVLSVTLAALGDRAHEQFGRVRVWGSIGFLLLVLVFPPLLRALQEQLGPSRSPHGPQEPLLWLIFPGAAVLVLASAAATFAVPESRATASRAGRGDWQELRRHEPFVRLLLVSLATYLFFQGPMSLFPLYLRAHGQGLDMLSQSWILMLLPEIPLVALSGSGLRRIGSRGLLAAGVAAGGLRWLVCGLVDDVRAIYVVQLLHGVTVTGVGIGAALYVEASVPARLRSTGQGLNATAGAGVGAIFSNVIAGWLMDHVSVNAPFVVGGAGALAIALAIPVWLPPPRRLADG